MRTPVPDLPQRCVSRWRAGGAWRTSEIVLKPAVLSDISEKIVGGLRVVAMTHGKNSV